MRERVGHVYYYSVYDEMVVIVGDRRSEDERDDGTKNSHPWEVRSLERACRPWWASSELLDAMPRIA